METTRAKLRGVNLGGWLVLEKWMVPSLFEGLAATDETTWCAELGPAAAAERLVVQVGAFSEEAGARAVRQKLEGAGLKTYTHVAQTPDGKRIRVRVGPFDNRADADKAAARVKALGLTAAVLTL